MAYQPLPIVKKQIEKEGISTESIILFPLSLYRNILSKLDGDRCPSHPSCSQYAREATIKHGAVLGLLMTVDRLIHERTAITDNPVITLPDGRKRAYDPLSLNDHWLTHSISTSHEVTQD
ncbi:MAG: membrane protein insertion efficiency factor YidD [Magnetococcales bacterium]|nr:membrane protein insertion efficiency factor YidD [Magnetococcales bacterium]